MEGIRKINVVTNPTFEGPQRPEHVLGQPLAADLLMVTSNFSNMGDASLASSVCMGGDDYGCESQNSACVCCRPSSLITNLQKS
jgi:hypothetical protein